MSLMYVKGIDKSGHEDAEKGEIIGDFAERLPVTPVPPTTIFVD